MPEIPNYGGGGLGDATVFFEEPYHEFWFHLGRFVSQFAKAESALLFLLWDVAGTSEEVSGAIFNGVRAEGARDAINNILTATKQTDRMERLRSPFSQMATIGTIRNNLVHWGAAKSEDDFIVTNTNRKPLKPKTFSISIDDFKDMGTDLFFILAMLVAERSDANEETRAIVARDFAPRPWRYKPPQPSPEPKMRDQDRSK
ncbi:MAG: hypothetical protein P4L76_18145 [Beijerinckiaceae bacterium]|nr:hypothetical protein [Beijerinckiaceae bacterium]